MTFNRTHIFSTVWRHWRSEFEIGYAAFCGDLIYCHTEWLAAQIWKEWGGSGVYGPAGASLAHVSGTAADEERTHFHMLSDLRPKMEVPPGAWEPGPASRVLVSTRNLMWQDEALRHGVAMSEGGGLGLFYGAIAAIDARYAARAQDPSVRDALTKIAGDEIGHIRIAVRAFERAALSPAQQGAALEALDVCLRLKIDERREQFAPQLSVSGINVPDEAVAAYQQLALAIIN